MDELVQLNKLNPMDELVQLDEFLDGYIMNAPLTGQAFTIDAVEVNSFIVNFITQNDEVESIIKISENERNSRKDWVTLKTIMKVKVYTPMISLKLTHTSRTSPMQAIKNPTCGGLNLSVGSISLYKGTSR